MTLIKLKTKKKKWALIILIFLMSITAIRLIWMNFLTTFEYPQSPSAEQGTLDLRGVELSDNQTLLLNGEWEFYPSTFISPEVFEENNDLVEDKKVDLHVPNNWNESFDSQDEHSFRYGTYRLRILLDHDEELFGLRINEIRNASAVFVNGQLVGSEGQTATELEHHQAHNIPYSIKITPENNEINLIIHASSHDVKGGITKSIRLGTIDAIYNHTSLTIGLQLLLCVILLFHGLYAVLLYFLGAKSKTLHYFSLFILSTILSVLVSDDKILFTLVHIEHQWSIKTVYFSYIGVAAFLPQMMNSLFPSYINPRTLRWFSIGCCLYAIFVLVSPFQYIIATSSVALSSVLILSVFISLLILRKAIIEKEKVIFLLLACLSIGVNILWAIIQRRLSTEIIHYPFDLIFALLAFSAFWFYRFFRATDETKQLAEKLQLEDRRKDKFLVNTSHELRNPLYGITNITQSILDDQKNPINKEHKKRLELLIQISDHMTFMLDDLLDLSRLKENRIRLHLTNVRVQAVTFGITDMIQLMLDGKPIRLNIGLPDTLPSVHADENRLIQILFNLMHNAVKYTDEGTITVRAEQRKGLVYVHVEDTGIGIEEEALQRIFLPYEQQASINETRASGGFGLGLSICKQLVELHGGTLTVSSTIGVGSVFSFTLPLAKDSAHEEPSNTILSINGSMEMAAATTNISGFLSDSTDSTKMKPKLLIVDDDNVNLKTIIHLLEVIDYQIDAVTSAKQAIAKLEKNRYDLVISDVMMPNVSGYGLTRLIRKRYTISELPVLLLTARGRSKDILAGFQAGANDYVKKPIDGKELKARVRALTDLKVSIEERLRMESAWLQSQIQPHFLFNTLNSIAALGLEDYSKMQALLEEFSNYLRFSIDFENADPVVSLEHELNLVRSYLYIEKVRFGERLNVQWEIEYDNDFDLPPLSIQPLVENAVRHGIMQRINGGTVCIRIEQQNKHIKVSISDNGKGLTEEEIKNIFKKEIRSDTRKGIGIQNIDRRLKQVYPDGLTLHSKVDQGTTVSFQIPLKKK